ncbi:tetratricopeptide repeat protein [Limobrevibacterium gyesilva]|uniref:Tetratricopeptide repeat protein n=1 Tax=Limobrevibacterium gyesilva TaxID=2991712 RepID=A0AA41YVK0_9PROT|nr:hypothetical protein [Limobrevibacterium gyesilva]MCW3476187.1 hypothetical protein [Limobrevibacterium gyesilva]
MLSWIFGTAAVLIWATLSALVWYYITSANRRNERIQGDQRAHLFLNSESQIADVVRQFPRSGVAAVRHAEFATAASNWDEAHQRWSVVRRRFPKDPRGYIVGARVLRELGRPDEAEAVLARARRHVRPTAEIDIAFAAAAHGRQAWKEAARRWAVVRRRHPKHKAGYLQGAAALRQIGKAAEADALVEAAKTLA